MRSFREEYQKEMDRVGTFHLEAVQVSDEIRHHRRKTAGRRRALITAASAAAVFLLVGGAATAMGYGSGLIRVRNNGFSITSESGEFTEDQGEEQPLERSRQRAEDAAAETDETEPEFEECEITAREYVSLESFRQEEDITVPLPDLQLVGGETAEVYINVLDAHLYISLWDAEGKSISLMQADHRGDAAYASSTVYGGEAANERNYTTGQGYTYKVIDIMEGNQLADIECAVSLYGRDLLVGFRGYTQEEAYAVLESMDLGVYVVDE